MAGPSPSLLIYVNQVTKKRRKTRTNTAQTHGLPKFNMSIADTDCYKDLQTCLLLSIVTSVTTVTTVTTVVINVTSPLLQLQTIPDMFVLVCYLKRSMSESPD